MEFAGYKHMKVTVSFLENMLQLGSCLGRNLTTFNMKISFHHREYSPREFAWGVSIYVVQNCVKLSVNFHDAS